LVTGPSVVDASVVFKRLILEDFSDQATRLVDDAIRSKYQLTAPYFMYSEVTNVLLQRHRTGGLSEQEADDTLTGLFSLPIVVADDPELYSRALSTAIRHGVNNAYDCVYLSLAQLTDLEYWTADLRFFGTLNRFDPRVRWIGDYPLDRDASP
jgi:predicted nucleic acid-binding protein